MYEKKWMSEGMSPSHSQIRSSTQMIANDTRDGWTVRNVQIEIRKGARTDWFQMRVGGKKFIVREVPNFLERGEVPGGKVASRRGGRS